MLPLLIFLTRCLLFLPPLLIVLSTEVCMLWWKVHVIVQIGNFLMTQPAKPESMSPSCSFRSSKRPKITRTVNSILPMLVPLWTPLVCFQTSVVMTNADIFRCYPETNGPISLRSGWKHLIVSTRKQWGRTDDEIGANTSL